MAKTIKMCDMSAEIAALVLQALNYPNVNLEIDQYDNKFICTDIEPKELIYPEGWYYANGNFRNKHQSTTGLYYEMPMLKSNGESWKESATYCTREFV